MITPGLKAPATPLGPEIPRHIASAWVLLAKSRTAAAPELRLQEQRSATRWRSKSYDLLRFEISYKKKTEIFATYEIT